MSGRSFVSPELRNRVRLIAVPVALVLGKLGLTPNALTIVGFLGTCIAAAAAAAQLWVLAGFLVIAFGIFDLFDGALARATNQASKFGAFLDSTLDRTGENLVYAGIAFGCAVAGSRGGSVSRPSRWPWLRSSPTPAPGRRPSASTARSASRHGPSGSSCSPSA